MTADGTLSLTGGGLTFTGGTFSGTPVAVSGEALTFPATGSGQVGTLWLTGADTLTGDVPAGVTLVVRPGNGITATLTPTGDLTNHGTLVVDTVDSYATGKLIVPDGITLTNAGTLHVTREYAGNDYRELDGTFVNHGTTTIDADVRLVGTFTNHGSVTIADGVTFHLDAATDAFTQAAGTLDPTTGTFKVSHGTFTYAGGHAAGSTLQLVDAALVFPSTTAQNGTIRVTGESSTLSGDVPADVVVDVYAGWSQTSTLTLPAAPTANAGTIQVRTFDGYAYANLVIPDGGTLTNDGLLDVVDLGGSSARTRTITGDLVNPGTFHVEATVLVQGDLTNTGTVTVDTGQQLNYGGASPDLFTFTQQSGTVDGDGYLNIAGNRVFDFVDGTLAGAAAHLDGATLTFPTAGDQTGSFDIFNTVTVTGDIPAGILLDVYSDWDATRTLTTAAMPATNHGTIQLRTYDGYAHANLVIPDGGTLTNAGRIEVDDLGGSSARERKITGNLVNTGTLHVTATLLDQGDLTNAGTLTIASGQTLTFGGTSPDLFTFTQQSGTVDGDGYLDVAGNRVVAFVDGSLAGGTAHLDGTDLRFPTAGTQTGVFRIYNTVTVSGDIPAGITLTADPDADRTATIATHGTAYDPAPTTQTSYGTIELGTHDQYGHANLSSPDGTTFVNAGTIHTFATGSLYSTSRTISRVDNQGTIAIDGPTTFTYPPDNLGTDGTLTGGRWELAGAISFTQPAPAFTTNAADVVFEPNGNVAGMALATNDAAGTLTVTGTRTLAVSTFTNDGAVRVDSGSVVAATTDYVQAGGETLLVETSSALSAGGTVTVTGGTLAGIGTVTGALHADGGSVAPGVDPGTPGVLNVDGDYTQSAGGRLDVDIAGTTPGTEHDQLAVTGTATLDGTVGVTPADGYDPAGGTQYTVLDAAAVSGGFAQADPADLAGIHYVPHTTATTAYLEVVRGPFLVTILRDGPDIGDGPIIGNVTSDTGTGISCGIDCDQLFPDGTTVNLVADLPTGGRFDHWIGAPECADGNPYCTIVVTAQREITAVWALEPYTLTVNAASGTGTGTVTSDPAGIDCPSVACEMDQLYGTDVTLTATPDADSVFAGWGVTDCPGTDPCTLTLDADKTVVPVFELKLPDLTVTAVDDPPVTAMVGTSIPVGDTTANVGTEDAPTTLTGYVLSLDDTYDAADLWLDTGRTVGPLAVGTDGTGTTTSMIPVDTPAATYHLLACADALAAVTEGDEGNNCLAATTTIAVTAPLPNLTVTAVADPPAFAAPGDTIEVGDTTANTGLGAAAASTTGYWLSTDEVLDAGDLALSAGRGVPTLAAGVDDGGTASLTIPAETAPGAYRLLACADGGDAIAETDEADNCAVAVEYVTVGSDLVPVVADTFGTDDGGWTVTGALSPPPLVVPTGGNPGGWLTALDASAWSAPAGYLGDQEAAYGGALVFDRSLDVPVTEPPGDDVTLTAGDGTVLVADAVPPADVWTRTVLPLIPDAWTDPSTGAPTTETTLRHVLADLVSVEIRADYADPSTNEGLDSVGLYRPAVAIPPSLADLLTGDVRAGTGEIPAGGRLMVEASTANIGTADAAPSRTTFLLSTDLVVDTGDVTLTGGLTVGALAIGDVTHASAVLAVPGGTTPGTYHLLACADGGGLLPELDETNNCEASGRTLTVTPSTGDLHTDRDTRTPPHVDGTASGGTTSGGGTEATDGTTVAVPALPAPPSDGPTAPVGSTPADGDGGGAATGPVVGGVVTVGGL